MKFQIIGKNIEITDAMRNKVIKKISELERFLTNDGKDLECRVVVRVYPHVQKIEVTITLNQAVLRAEEVHEDLYAAIDLVVDKLEAQMSRVKARLDRRHRDKLSKSLIWDEIEESENTEIQYVRTKTIFAERLDLDEAIAKMELLGHDFFVFHDIDDNKPAVVYKRLTGGYGVIMIND